MNLPDDRVVRSKEFERIAHLPRRTLSLDFARECADALTPMFALNDTARLRPWQAVSLVEAVSVGGAWLALPVGHGKTLISWLLPTALRSQRALLVVSGSLLDKTYADFASYRGVWLASPAVLRVETREMLSVVGGADLLTTYKPDLIIIDEADDLANANSAAARRIDRYVRTHDVRVVAMTGTPSRKSLLGYWHLLAWCLGDGAPLPLGIDEARIWAAALDEHKRPRPHLGPLGRSLKAAREWYRRRLADTPGVVIVDEDSCAAPLTVRLRLAREDVALDAAFERLLVEHENPGGIPISDPLSLWLLDGQLGLGLYSRWNPPPPEEWSDARRAVARFVRERIADTAHAARPLDTELQVMRRHATHPTVTHWREIKPTFDGTTETVWISRATLDSCLDWLRELGDAIGIVWCGCVEFGRRLADEAGLMYYGRRGRNDAGVGLHDAPTNASIVASWKANKKGFNLQAWARQLVVMPPQSAKWFEQIFGRSHRSGQQADVIVDVLATSGGTLDAFELAIAEARFARDTISLTSKLLRADIVRVTPAINSTNAFRWARRKRCDAEDTPIWKDWEVIDAHVKVYITQRVKGQDKLVRRSQKRAVYVAPNGRCYRKDKVDALWKNRPREDGAHVWLSLVDDQLTMAWQSFKRRGRVRLAPVEY